MKFGGRAMISGGEIGDMPLGSVSRRICPNNGEGEPPESPNIKNIIIFTFNGLE
jgi:hypothetical protein